MDAAAFLENLKSKVHPEAIAGHDTVLHFNITGDNATQKTVQIADGKIDVLDGLVGEAKCVVTAKAETLMKLVKGEENPMMAFMMGKIKVSNPGELMKYGKILGLM
jgi:putative sterol carrier protein